MAISPSNIEHNHRSFYAEFVGDGASTALTIPLPVHYGGQALTGRATVRTGATAFTHESGKGGHLFPAGTDVPVTSAVVSGGNVTITTTAAVANGTKAYVAFVYDQYTARG